MAKISKETEQRQELHSKIWKIADEVRGAVDGWDFKQWVLGILFYRFISEDIDNYLSDMQNEYLKVQGEEPNFSYASSEFNEEQLEEIKQMAVNDKGYFIQPSDLFVNVVNGCDQDDDLNVNIRKVFDRIEGSAIGAESEQDIKGLFDELQTTGTILGQSIGEKNKRLRNILHGIADINFDSFDSSNIDIFGDAYEFLISKYASNAGKSGGEYFTPQSVSKLLSQIVTLDQESINKVYDPACGSGSLLLQMKKQFDDHVIIDGFYGQEINPTNYNLCRMNMFLHNINYNKFDIKLGDTLLEPKHNNLKPFDAIVSNPPYSIKWEGDKNPVLVSDERFAPAGKLAPKNNADMAFVLHCLSYLSSKGRAAIVCFPGIFYRTGAEQKIRQYLIEGNFVETIISLPTNLFYGTSIGTNILVLSKGKKDDNVQFIDATKFFKKETNNNILTDENISNIIKLFKVRKNVDYYSYLANIDEIREQDYNLSVNSYVEKEDTREEIDIVELNKEIEETVKNIDQIRKEIDNLVKGELKDV